MEIPSRTVYIRPRCHLGSRPVSLSGPCALQGTIIPPATHVCPHVVEYSLAACSVQLSRFDHALSGPFDDLFLTRLSATRALWKGIIAVISASTVFCCALVYHVFWPLSTGQRQICHFNSYTGRRIANFLTISQGDHMSFVLLSRSSKNSFMRMSGLRRTRPSSRARGMKTNSFSRSSQ